MAKKPNGKETFYLNYNRLMKLERIFTTLGTECKSRWFGDLIDQEFEDKVLKLDKEFNNGNKKYDTVG